MKAKPVAFCTVCKQYSNNITCVNTPHRRTKYGDRCRGVFSSALNEDDWQSCSNCAGEGLIKGETCIQCEGWGWILSRRSF